jgi:hypothetical protein
MANTFRKGFWPLDEKNTELRIYPIGSANGTNVFVGDVVKIITGSSAAVPGSVAPATATDYNNMAGTVVSLFDAGGTSPVPGQNAPNPIGNWASTVTTKYLPSSTQGYALVAVAKPGVRFVCQTNTIINNGFIGKSTALVAGAGNTTTAQSGHVINGNDGNGSYPAFLVLGPWSQLTAGGLGTGTGAGALNDITLAGALWIVEFGGAYGFMTGTNPSTGV